MSRNILFAASAGIIVGIIALAFSSQFFVSKKTTPAVPCHDFNQGKITIGQKQLSLAIANTFEEQARGLGGCTEVPADSGMLFPYNPAQQISFWMKDMVIPIDIIWIHNGKVVGIEHKVPPPPKGTPDTNLAIYTPREPVDNVLEIKSGGAAEYGIEIGSDIVLK